MQLSTCVAIATDMGGADRDELLSRLDGLIAAGVPADRAQSMVAVDMVAEIEAEIEEMKIAVREQHPDLFEEAKADDEPAPLRFFGPDEDGPAYSRREGDPSRHSLAGGRVRMTVDELVEAAKSQKSWRGWYDKHIKVLEEMFGADAPLFSDILAATSQASTVASNVALAVKAYKQLKLGAPFTGYLPAVVRNLNRLAAKEELTGSKISQYKRANSGDGDGMAVDRHIAQLMFRTDKPNLRQIRTAQQRMREVADRLGWKPREVQAALWAYNQVLKGKNPDEVQTYDTFLTRREAEVAETRRLARAARGRGPSLRGTRFSSGVGDGLRGLPGRAGDRDGGGGQNAWIEAEGVETIGDSSLRNSARENLAGALAARNKTLKRVNPASVLEADISRAAEAINIVAGELAKGNDQQLDVPVGPVPHVLHMLGAPMQMLKINTSIVDKLLFKKHADEFTGVTPRELVDAIYRPVLVTQSRGKDEFEMVTGLRNTQGQPISFVVKSGTFADTKKGSPPVSVASVMSAYARPLSGKPNSVLDRVLAGASRYVDMGAAPGAINNSLAQSSKSPTPGAAANIVPERASSVNGLWSKFGPTLVGAAKAKRVRTDVDLMRFIGDNYAGDWADAPSYSRRQAPRYDLPNFGVVSQTIEAIQDRYNRWKQTIDAVREHGGVVNDTNDFWLAEERYWGRTGARVDDFAKEVERFAADVTADGLSLGDVALYSYAKHAPERNAYIAGQRASMPDGGSGMSNQEAQDIIDEAAASGLQPALERHSQTMKSWIQGTRDLLLAEGLIDQGEYDAWNQSYAEYVPLRGLEGVPGARGTGQGFNIRGDEGKRAMGRRSQARQIIEQIIQDRTRSLIRAGKNEVLRSLAQFVLDNPDPGLWEINAVETKPVSTVDAFGNRIIDERQVIVSDDRTVTVKDGGKEVHILIHDETLRNQLQNLNAENPSRVIGALLWSNRVLSRLYTSLSPTFTVLNGARDFTAASFGIIDEIGFMGVPRLWANLPKALWESFQAEAGNYSADYQLYRASGGKTGFFDFKDLDAQTAALMDLVADAERSIVDPRKFGPKALHLIEAINGGIENAVRLAAFKTARQTGGTLTEAAHVSKNITVNFNRKGSMTPALSAWFLFFNPAVQGTTRMLQALKSPKVLAALGMGMAGIAGLALRNAGMGDDDDGVAWWDKVPPEVKERNIIIVLPPGASGGEAVPGSKIGRYVKVPMPYGYNFFAVVANQVADLMRHEADPRRGVDLLRATTRAFSAFMGSWIPVSELGRSFETPQSAVLAAVPDALNPVAQVLINTSTFGRELRPEDKQSRNMPDSTKFFGAQAGTIFERAAGGLNAATGGSPYVSGLIDVAPSTLETVARGYGGGPVSFMLDVLNGIYARQSIKRPDIDVRRMPFVKQLYGQIDAETDRLVGYERLEQAEKAVQPIERALKDGKTAEAREMASDFGAISALGGAIKTTRERMSQMRKEELRIIADEALPESIKYAKLQAVAERRRQALQQFNSVYDRAILKQAEADKRAAGQ